MSAEHNSSVADGSMAYWIGNASAGRDTTRKFGGVKTEIKHSVSPFPACWISLGNGEIPVASFWGERGREKYHDFKECSQRALFCIICAALSLLLAFCLFIFMLPTYTHTHTC